MGFLLFGRKYLSHSPRVRFLLAFAVLGYVVWLMRFSIIRYAIPIEIIGSSITVLGFATLIPIRVGRIAAPTAVILVCVTSQMLTSYPQWGRLPYSYKDYGIEIPPVDNGALIVVATQPASYLLPYFEARELRFVGAIYVTGRSIGYRLYARTLEIISNHHGRIYTIERAGGNEAGMFSGLGMQSLPETCKPIRSNLEPSADLKLCEARKL